MHLQESAEMYLETIYILSKESVGVRSIDVAQQLGYSRASVSRAVNLLKKDGYLAMDEDAFLSLTDKGKAVAEKIYERHTVLRGALMALGVDEVSATEDACRIEHVISDKTFEALKAHLSQYEGGTV